LCWRFLFAGEDVWIWIGILVPFIYNGGLLSIELCLGKFRKFMSETIFNQTLEYFLSADAIEQGSTDPSPDADLVELGTMAPVSKPQLATKWESLPELKESILHWSKVSDMKALWTTTDGNDRQGDIAHVVYDILSSPQCDGSQRIALVDVSRTHSTVWPLIRGFTSVCPQYKEEINKPATPLSKYFKRFIWRPSSFGVSGKWDVSPHTADDNMDTIVSRLIYDPLRAALDRLARKNATHGRDPEGAQASVMSPIVLIVHGVRDVDQADELFGLIKKLKRGTSNTEYFKHISIVVITGSKLLRHVSDGGADILNYTYTSYISDAGSVVYSGKQYSSLLLEESVLQLLVSGIHRLGGAESESLLSQLTELGLLSGVETQDKPDESTTISILTKLYQVSTVSKQFGKVASLFIQKRLIMANVSDLNNAKTAELLHQLFELNSYKTFNSSSFIHGDQVLDHGLPKNHSIKDPHVFQGRAHYFLNWVATYLKLLPDDVSICDIVLQDEHPVKHGGFSDVYRGIHKDANGVKVEVALKVLKIFQDQTDKNRAILHGKFVKEALVWHRLRHENIIPFLGVDYTTFASPLSSRAMVSPWMLLGSVLNYMEKPPYAMQMLDGVIRGLAYLHSNNVVHGDLCGVHFGLAGFIDNDISNNKSSTRGGSIRWMAPELIIPPPDVPFKRTPASDVWALGCVCCEIWSEGTAPFIQFPTETGALLAIASGREESPYPNRPSDEAENLMPDRLWELTHWCFQYDRAQRPTAEGLGKMFSIMQEAPHVHAPAELKSPPTPALATVRLGPLDASNPEETFGTIFESLCAKVRTGGLVKPVMVEDD
ncbi:kinase-like domain-containing protein, partial [Mycena leptocephala]